ILITTHQPEEAEHCDRLAVLDHGRVIACDTPEALRRQVGGDVVSLDGAAPEALAAEVRARFGLEARVVHGAVVIETPRGRQLSRVVGALVQPLIFWLVIGSGLSGSFRMQGADGVGYVQYFYPGIVMLVVLFTSIFTTMSVIEDRHKGFLQAVLVAPASRAALVLGKTLGGVAIALMQAAIFLALAPLAGFDVRAIHWGELALLLVLIGVGLSSMGF